MEGPDVFNTKRIPNSFLFISFSVDVSFKTLGGVVWYPVCTKLFNTLSLQGVKFSAGDQASGRDTSRDALAACVVCRPPPRRARQPSSSEAGPTKPTPPLRCAAPRAPRPAARRLREHQRTLDGLRTFLVSNGCVRYGKG